MSMDEFASNTPVRPPTVNKKIKPKAHSMGVSKDTLAPVKVANHLNTFTPVGIAMIIVAAVK